MTQVYLDPKIFWAIAKEINKQANMTNFKENMPTACVYTHEGILYYYFLIG